MPFAKTPFPFLLSSIPRPYPHCPLLIYIRYQELIESVPMKKHYTITIGTLLSLFLCSCAQTSMESADVTVTQIYGGQTAPDAPSVGALISSATHISFCTATLITPKYAITAAHCIHNKNSSDFYFTNVENTNTVMLSQEIPIAAIHIHPEFRNESFVNDIALIELSYEIKLHHFPQLNKETLDESFIEYSPTFIGYGRSEYDSRGERRMADIPVSFLGLTTFTCEYDPINSTGICFGDSGGPAFSSSTNDELLLVGVVSNIISYDPQKACIGYYNVTRIDKYLQWIYAIIDDFPALSCADTPEACICSQACLNNGQCDSQHCKTMNCEQSYDCVASCSAGNGACINDCYIQTQTTSLAQFEKFVKCGGIECEYSPEASLLSCLNTNCQDSFHSCFEIDNCNLQGGDCPLDQTCTLARFSLTRCEPTLNLLEGAQCDPSGDSRQCADGHICIPNGQKYRCLKRCNSHQDCPDTYCMPEETLYTNETNLQVCAYSPPRAIAPGCNVSTIPRTASILNLWKILL